MAKRKTRNQKAVEYEKKFSHIPIDFNERMKYIFDTYHINDRDSYNINMARMQMMNQMRYTTFNIVLFEQPEGSPRPRFRIVNRANLSNMAISNPNFVHVYSLTGHEDNVFMKRLISAGELQQLDTMIYTPCVVDIFAYIKTPSYYNKEQTVLAEIGMDRPMGKPDWDNIGKKYSDMFNKNVWLDDTQVVDGSVHKYFSILPRIEIRISYLNMLYNRHQYKSLSNREEDAIDTNYFRGRVDYL